MKDETHWNYQHGMSRSSEYNSWSHMKYRCYNRSSGDYYLYGAIGVKVCDEWKEDFTTFYEDMGEKPDGTSLDRYPDSSGNYEPSNCRWATPKEQSDNKRNNIILEHEGVTMSVGDWAEEAGMPTETMRKRLRRGLSVEDSISLPYNYDSRRSKLLSFDGKELTIEQWSGVVGIDVKTLVNRHRKDWSVEKILTTKKRSW